MQQKKIVSTQAFRQILEQDPLLIYFLYPAKQDNSVWKGMEGVAGDPSQYNQLMKDSARYGAGCRFTATLFRNLADTKNQQVLSRFLNTEQNILTWVFRLLYQEYVNLVDGDVLSRKSAPKSFAAYQTKYGEAFNWQSLADPAYRQGLMRQVGYDITRIKPEYRSDRVGQDPIGDQFIGASDCLVQMNDPMFETVIAIPPTHQGKRDQTWHLSLQAHLKRSFEQFHQNHDLELPVGWEGLFQEFITPVGLKQHDGVQNCLRYVDIRCSASHYLDARIQRDQDILMGRIVREFYETMGLQVRRNGDSRVGRIIVPPPRPPLPHPTNTPQQDDGLLNLLEKIITLQTRINQITELLNMRTGQTGFFSGLRYSMKTRDMTVDQTIIAKAKTKFFIQKITTVQDVKSLLSRGDRRFVKEFQDKAIAEQKRWYQKPREWTVDLTRTQAGESKEFLADQLHELLGRSKSVLDQLVKLTMREYAPVDVVASGYTLNQVILARKYKQVLNEEVSDVAKQPKQPEQPKKPRLTEQDKQALCLSVILGQDVNLTEAAQAVQGELMTYNPLVFETIVKLLMGLDGFKAMRNLMFPEYPALEAQIESLRSQPNSHSQIQALKEKILKDKDVANFAMEGMAQVVRVCDKIAAQKFIDQDGCPVRFFIIRMIAEIQAEIAESGDDAAKFDEEITKFCRHWRISSSTYTAIVACINESDTIRGATIARKPLITGELFETVLRFEETFFNPAEHRSLAPMVRAMEQAKNHAFHAYNNAWSKVNPADFLKCVTQEIDCAACVGIANHPDDRLFYESFVHLLVAAENLIDFMNPSTTKLSVAGGGISGQQIKDATDNIEAIVKKERARIDKGKATSESGSEDRKSISSASASTESHEESYLTRALREGKNLDKADQMLYDCYRNADTNIMVLMAGIIRHPLIKRLQTLRKANEAQRMQFNGTGPVFASVTSPVKKQ